MFEIDLDDADFFAELAGELEEMSVRETNKIARNSASYAGGLARGECKSRTGSGYVDGWFYREATRGGVASVGNESDIAPIMENGAKPHEIPGPLKIPGVNPNEVGSTGTASTRQVRGIFGPGGSSRRGSAKPPRGTFIPEGKSVNHPGFTGFHHLERGIKIALDEAGA